MSQEYSRRRWLQLVAAGVLLPGCDTIKVDVEQKITGAADGDGLVPITPNDAFYQYQHAREPSVDVAAWTLDIRADGQTVATLDAAFFDGLVPIELEHTLQCIGGNPRNTLINNAVWGGLPFDEILAQLSVSVPDDTIEVVFQAADSYHTSIPVSDLQQQKLWLVWQSNGESLAEGHGAPCRFLVQGRYGTKNVKWPTVVDLFPGHYTGYWEGYGWSFDAIYRQNGYIFYPQEGTIVEPNVLIYGTAFAGEDPVSRVEISVDGGSTWTDAEIYYSPGPNIWTLWRFRYEGPAGAATAQIRVTTASGAMTTGTDGTDQHRGYDGGMRVSFEVLS